MVCSFRPGHGTALGFAFCNFAMALVLYLALSRENRRRDQTYGQAPRDNEVHEYEDPAYLRKWGLEGMTRDQIVALGDDHPAYRYML